MPEHQLLQLNIAKMKYGFEDPELADFVATLDGLRHHGPGAKVFTFKKLFEPE